MTPEQIAPVEHELKTWPAVFQAMRRGEKKFEYRRNDRLYRVGDTILSREWNPETKEYTGEQDRFVITFVLDEDNFGVPFGFAVLSVDPIPSLPPLDIVDDRPQAEPVACPDEYSGPFFAYDFAPQKIMMKSSHGDAMALDVLSVRGWGHLTGKGGGLGINPEAAAKIQDNFGKWVVETLNAALTRPSLRLEWEQDGPVGFRLMLNGLEIASYSPWKSEGGKCKAEFMNKDAGWFENEDEARDALICRAREWLGVE